MSLFLTHKEMKMHMRRNGHYWSKYAALEKIIDVGDHLCKIIDVRSHFNQTE